MSTKPVARPFCSTYNTKERCYICQTICPVGMVSTTTGATLRVGSQACLLCNNFDNVNTEAKVVMCLGRDKEQRRD